jgi:hypothetical protein
MVRTAFPDFKLTIEDQVAEGDKEVHRLIARGTHKGDFMDIAPTNKQVETSAIAIDHISGGKVMKTWAEIDMFGMMQQLGVIPLPDKGDDNLLSRLFSGVSQEKGQSWVADFTALRSNRKWRPRQSSAH